MDRILSAVFPTAANNDYQGSYAVVWILSAITVIEIIRSLIHILKDDGGAQSIATIPLDRYPKHAADGLSLIHI